jgi:hypothetical protein
MSTKAVAMYPHYTQPTGTTATSNVSSFNLESRSRRQRGKVETIEFVSPPETPPATSLYRAMARAILAGKKVQVKCAGPYSLRRVRSGVRNQVERNGNELRSESLGLTLWMELKNG